MGWLFRRGSPPSKGDEVDGSGPHASPAFALLLDTLRRLPGPRILDLGAAVAANLDLFASLRAHLRVVDLLNDPAPLAEQLPRDEPPFDAVLGWNLFDHLPPPSLPGLVEQLEARTRQGGWLFVLLARRADRPVHPASLRVVDAETLAYTVGQGPREPGPRHTPAALEKLLSGFTVERTFLLRHGVQEYLFRRTPPSP